MIFGVTWRRRRAPGARPLLGMMAGIILWSWTYALYWLAPNTAVSRFWLDATYFGVVTAPTMLFLFAMELIRKRSHLERKWLALLAVEPLLTLLILWTDPWHGWFYGPNRTDASNILSGGWWFWVNVVYSYTLILAALIQLVNSSRKARGVIYRRQIQTALAGVLVFVATNLAALAGFNPFPGLDLTPLIFVGDGVFFLLSLLQYRMLDIVPIATDVLVDTMSDGMIVFDLHGRILEINKSAAALFKVQRSDLVGKEQTFLTQRLPEFGQVFQASSGKSGNFELTLNGEQAKVFDVQLIPIIVQGQEPDGLLLTWRNVTPLAQAQDELRQANQALQTQLEKVQVLQAELQEQALHDPLTGLFNRRFLDEALKIEITRCDRQQSSLALLSIDLDHFKRINDTYGHQVGDEVLRQTARRLENNLRSGDLVARYGGEEFVVVMINTLAEAAWQRAQELCAQIAASPMQVEAGPIQVTASIGVAGYPLQADSPAELISRADKALYQAKDAGRNRAVLADQSAE